ncbi:hypothetical protein F5Y04DRAFT_287790 [Hypomontagnella monticulosa]|nr:hypothetical protein F5Y04DRAFT_287790 [Hypomontagnella monticulosa]
MPLQYLHDACQGQELATKLRESWPNCFAVSQAQQKLCAGLEVIRWIISVLAESGSPMITIDRTDMPLLLAVAHYPIQSTVTIRGLSEIQGIISKVTLAFSAPKGDGSGANLLEFLESAMMVQALWSKPEYLLYQATLKREGNLPLPDAPLAMTPAQIARDGLITLDDPEKLISAVTEKLASRTYYHQEYTVRQLHTFASPQLIRVNWTNPSQWDQSRGSPMELFHSFKIRRPQSAEVEGGQPQHLVVDVSYTLICLARVTGSWHKDEPAAVAAHKYTINGQAFLSGHGNDWSQNWSCEEPGNYYLVYYKTGQSPPGQEALGAANPRQTIESKRDTGFNLGSMRRSLPPDGEREAQPAAHGQIDRLNSPRPAQHDSNEGPPAPLVSLTQETGSNDPPLAASVSTRREMSNEVVEVPRVQLPPQTGLKNQGTQNPRPANGRENPSTGGERRIDRLQDLDEMVRSESRSVQSTPHRVKEEDEEEDGEVEDVPPAPEQDRRNDNIYPSNWRGSGRRDDHRGRNRGRGPPVSRGPYVHRDTPDPRQPPASRGRPNRRGRPFPRRDQQPTGRNDQQRGSGVSNRHGDGQRQFRERSPLGERRNPGDRDQRRPDGLPPRPPQGRTSNTSANDRYRRRSASPPRERPRLHRGSGHPQEDRPR